MKRFTPKAQRVLALAKKEADRFNHNYVGSEHLLLGIVKLAQGIAAAALERQGLDLEGIRMEVEKQVGTGPDKKECGNTPYTPRVKKVLALAHKEAKALNHPYVGTEHLLLGLLREGEGVASRVLQSLSIAIKETRTAILFEIDPNYVPEKDILLTRRKPVKPWGALLDHLHKEWRFDDFNALCDNLNLNHKSEFANRVAGK